MSYDYMKAVGDRDVVLFDLDSTLADTRHRRHLAPTADETKTWVDYSMACGDDIPVQGTVRLAQLLWAAGYGLYIVSWRREEARGQTVDWLRRHGVPFHSLRLAMPGDYDDSTAYKVGYIEELRHAGLDPVLFVEDWPPLAEAIQRAGVPVVCVNAYIDQFSEPVHL